MLPSMRQKCIKCCFFRHSVHDYTCTFIVTLALIFIIAGLQLPGVDCSSATSFWRSHCRHGGQIRRQHPQELCQRPISHLHSHGSHAPVWAVPIHLLPVWCGWGAAVCLHVRQVYALRLWRL